MAKLSYGDRKWDDRFYARSYALAKSGMADAAIAKALGVGPALFAKWVAAKPALAEALAEGREPGREMAARDENAYRRLGETAQDFWDRVEASEPEDKDCGEVIRDKRRVRLELDEELAAASDADRMELWLHAYQACNFNGAEACRKLGIGRRTVELWRAKPGFKEALREVRESKKDLFESALVGLVKRGETAAVIFANRTYNRDRGYNDKVEVSHRAEERFALDDLGLSLEERRFLLCKLREAATPKLEDNSDVVDAEFSEGAG